MTCRRSSRHLRLGGLLNVEKDADSADSHGSLGTAGNTVVKRNHPDYQHN